MSSDGMPSVVAKRLGYALKRAQHALRISMDEAMRPAGLTAPQYAVLSAVEAEAGLSNARLARAAFVTPQAMQGVLANLERQGLLTRTPDTSNARVLRAALTAQGRGVLAQAHAAVSVVERRMLHALAEWDAERLAEALTRCAEQLRSTKDEA